MPVHFYGARSVPEWMPHARFCDKKCAKEGKNTRYSAKLSKISQRNTKNTLVFMGTP